MGSFDPNTPICFRKKIKLLVCGHLVVTILVINFERMMFMFKTMTDGILSIALTGHRPDKLAGYNLNNPFYGRLHERLMKIIERALDNYPLVECHSGMALGADTVWADDGIRMGKFITRIHPNSI